MHRWHDQRSVHVARVPADWSPLPRPPSDFHSHFVLCCVPRLFETRGSRLEKGNHALELTYFYRSGKIGEGILRQGSGLELKYSLLGNGWMNQVRVRYITSFQLCLHACLVLLPTRKP